MVNRATRYNPAVLRWARERSGFGLPEAAKAVGRPPNAVAEWEAGSASPTWNQLETLARLFRRPVALFFFPEPPAEQDAESEFRGTIEVYEESLHPDTRLAVREARAWQHSLYELTGGRNTAIRRIVQDLAPTHPSAHAAVVARQYLGVATAEQFRWPNQTAALKAWRAALEAVGVFVFKRSFEQTSVSGFCLHDDEFPVIVVNNSTTETRQVFTLFHELAHLLARLSGITQEAGGEPGAAGPLEAACDSFAAELLVPSDDFSWGTFDDGRPIGPLIIALGRRYKVSRLVILRKLRDRGIIEASTYARLWGEWNREYLERRVGDGNGGSYYANQAVYLGDAFTRLAFGEYRRGRVTLPELADHLRMKVRSVEKFEDYLFSVQK